MTATDPALLIEELRSEIRALSERLEQLEAASGRPAPEPSPAQADAPASASETQPAAPPTATHVEPEGISEEILMVISAAVAAFLGERAHIRQVRLIRSPAWAQQGRVTIQASHQLQH